MMTSRFLGKAARSPKRAMACSWLPQTCMTEMVRPAASTSRRSASARARARAGSRNLSSSRRSATTALAGRLARGDLAADVLGHEIARPGLLQDLVEEGQGLADLPGRDAPDGEAHVVQHVVAHRHRLVDDVEPELLPHAEEVHLGRHPVIRDGEDLTGHTQAHGSVSGQGAEVAEATTACPRAIPPSPGGTRPGMYTSKRPPSSPTRSPASRAFWNTPPVATTGRRPWRPEAIRTSSAPAAASARWNRMETSPAPVPRSTSSAAPRTMGRQSSCQGVIEVSMANG